MDLKRQVEFVSQVKAADAAAAGKLAPAERIARIAHAHGAKVLFDGSQAIVHRRVDVQAIDADFYAWTGHKLYGPTGIGVLWARRELLDRMPPFLGGGESSAPERVRLPAGAARDRDGFPSRDGLRTPARRASACR